MNITPAEPLPPDPAARAFYVDAMQTLDRAKIPYLVGGGFAMAYYTGIARNTKDLDLFIKPEDRDRTLTTLTAAGYRTEFFFPFWIAKALCGDAFIDLLYSSGNGVCVVDDEWLQHGIENDVLGYRTRLTPPEEQLWSKAFVQDRDRFDGADVNHLILCQGERMDWERILRRFEGHEPVLLAHAILFRYTYPSEQDCVPECVMQRLMEASEAGRYANGKLCRGGFLAHKSYGTALHEWGFKDARLRPYGKLTEEELAQLPEK
jgi:hypothetical protein